MNPPAPTLASLQADLAAVRSTVDANQNISEGFFFMLCSIFIFMMQLGFGLLEAGTVRSKNVKTALLKNVLDLSVAAIFWYLIGHSLSGASGDYPSATSAPGSIAIAANTANGTTNVTGLPPQAAALFLNVRGNYSPDQKDISQFVLLYGFLATADTIVSGAVLARMNIYAYLASTILMAVWVYPVGTFWMWNTSGWLYQLGAIDNAGGSVVHVVGGTTAFVACYLSGPRHGRYMRVSGKWIDLGIEPHNVVLQTTGCMLLYIGWLSFNSSSLYVDGSVELVQVAMRNTLLGGSAGFVVTFIYKHLGKQPVYPKQRKFLVPALTGSLAGLAGVTSNCGVTSGWAAISIGALCAIACVKSSELLARWRIDDPVDAVGVHLVAGSLGTILTGLFANPEAGAVIRGVDWLPGLFYPPYSFHLLGSQLVTVVVYIVWSGAQSWILLYLLKKFVFKEAFTYSTKAQVRGLDYALNGGVAYPDFTFINISSSAPTDSGSSRRRGEENLGGAAGGKGGGNSKSALSIVADGTDDKSGLRQRHEIQQEQESFMEPDLGVNDGVGETDEANIAIELVNSVTQEQVEVDGGDKSASGDAGTDGEAGEASQNRSKKSVPKLEIAACLRIMDDCSDDDRQAASPGNRLDEIMDGVEKRCIVIMTGLQRKYSLAAIKAEVDRDFLGDYTLLGLVPEANTVVVALRTPLVVMRFAAQFKIERWSQALPGSTVTDSGTVVELESPNVEYCKMQEHQEVLELLDKNGMVYVRPG